jgi:adenylyltransferase/sulfurtransferase
MSKNTVLTESELYRYSRQIRLAEIGRQGQMKIKESAVLVIGAGALGCAALQYLTAAGVGTIGIIDNDWVDESNLHRQVLYNIKDIGKPKPLAAIEKLELLNPEVTFKSLFFRLNKESVLNIISAYDIIVDCSDNFATRYLINDSCVILNKPLVYGEILKFTGQLIVLNYRNGPTLRCICPDPPHPLEIPTCAETGVIGSIAGIIGSMQATEVIKIILNKEGVLSGKLFSFDSLNFTTQIVPLEKDPESSIVKELGEYQDLCLSEKDTVQVISPGELKTMLAYNSYITIIDLREEEEITDLGFESISIPHYKISEYIPQILSMNVVVFYCTYGIRSMYVINYLQNVHKKENLYNLVL